jgi:hypothetical protein
MFEEALEQAFARRCGEAVGTGFGQAASRLFAAQAIDSGLQAEQNLVGGKCMGRGAIWCIHGASGD